jgi:phage anti-repressor protein
MENFLKTYSKVPNEFINDFFRISKESYEDNEFKIDIEIIAKWLNIRKDNLKRILIKNFNEGVDYIIEKKKFLRDKKSGSTYKDIILLTPDCFKELCMLSSTPKAKEVRLYYLQIEKLIRKYNKKIQDDLYKKIGILKKNQKPTISKKSGVIYILEAFDTDKENLHKIGKTSDLKKRLEQYNSGLANKKEPLFILEVDDIDKTEKCVKNLVKHYQYRKYKEIYEIQLDLLKGALCECDDLINGFKKLEGKYKKKEINQKFKTLKQKGGVFNILINK